MSTSSQSAPAKTYISEREAPSPRNYLTEKLTGAEHAAPFLGCAFFVETKQ